jgi:hypothetical protein
MSIALTALCYTFFAMAKTKNPAAVALGRLGGIAKGKPKGLATLTPEERTERARQGAKARWAGVKKKGEKKTTKKIDKQ